MVKSYLSIGSNIGDRLHMLSVSLKELNNTEGIEIKKISSVYETAPVGYTDQDNFLNIAVEIETKLKPEELLKIIQKIELKLKRERKIHWGPRTIDIDIIDYDHQFINSEELILPHKEALNRAFVLLPLMEITSEDFVLNGQKIKDALNKAPHGKDIIWLCQENLPS